MAKGVPAAIAAAAAEADKFLETMDQAAPPGEPVLEPETSPTPPAEPQPVAPTPSDISSEIRELREQLEYERHRNDSLEGRLEAQLRPANDTIRDLRIRIAQLEEQAAKPATPAVPPERQFFSKEELEQVDPQALAVSEKAARGVVAAEAEKLRQDAEARSQAMEERLAQLEAERQQAEFQKFWDAVDSQVPNASKINAEDPKWARFLEGTDTLSGRKYRELGEDAIASRNVRAVVALFQEFLKQSPAPAARMSADDGKVRSQVRPEVSAGAPPAVAPAAGSPSPMIRESAIRKFYADWSKGKYTPEEAAKMESAIEKAVSEGRVVFG